MTDGSLCLSVFGGATQLTATETHTSESRKKQLTEERERESRWGIARDGATRAYLCPFLITLVRASSPPSLGRVPAGLGRRGGAGGHPGALPSAKPASRWVAPVPAASRAAPLPTTARRAKAGRGASLGRRRPPTFATSRRVNAVVRPPSRCRTGARLGGPTKAVFVRGSGHDRSDVRSRSAGWRGGLLEPRCRGDRVVVRKRGVEWQLRRHDNWNGACRRGPVQPRRSDETRAWRRGVGP
jgi:hypothetical protein